jgi:hypothetical protein
MEAKQHLEQPMQEDGVPQQKGRARDTVFRGSL